MSFFLKALGYASLVMAAVVISCAIVFVWVRHGPEALGDMFALGGGLDAIVLIWSFGPGIAILLAGCWMDRRARQRPN